MLIRDFPRWAGWVMSLAVIGILVGFAYFLRWTGPEFCYGLIAGFLTCYFTFGCWRRDYDEPMEPLSQQPQSSPPHSHDRIQGR